MKLYQDLGDADLPSERMESENSQQSEAECRIERRVIGVNEGLTKVVLKR